MERRILRNVEADFALEVEAKCWQESDATVVVEGMIRDVSVEQKDLAKLRHEKKILDTVLANIPHSVFWKDRDSVYLGCNERFLKDTGLPSKDAVVGKSDLQMPWADTDAESYRSYDAYLDVISNFSLKYRRKRKPQADGSQKFIVTSKVPLADSSGKIFGILGIYMDITEHRRVQLKVAEQQAAIHGVSKMAALGEMAAGIAHEIKNPMAVIGALASEISLELEEKEQNLILVRSNLEGNRVYT